MPYIDMEEPRCANVRREMELPRETKSKMDKELPNLANP
jgi:hypothetical protein